MATIQDPYIAADGTVVMRTRETTPEDDNRDTLLALVTAAMAANRADITQAQAIITQAQTLEATTGTRTGAQLSGDVRSLAQAVRLLAQQSQAQAKELNHLLRLVLGQLDGTD